MFLRAFAFVAAFFVAFPSLGLAHDKLTYGMNRFGTTLLSRLVEKADQNENVLVSPYSVSSALEMTVLGAAGKTRTEMQDVLGLPKNWINAQQNLTESLQKEPEVTLSVANGIWGAKDVQFRHQFSRQARRIFNARIVAVDFSDPAILDVINGWVSDATKGMIPSLIDRLNPNLAAVLVNALYFKGDWKDAFDPKLTVERDFHFADGYVAPVSLMHKRDDFAYAKEDGWQAVALPYAGDGFELVVALPEEGHTPLESLDSALHAKFQTKKGYLGLPKMDLSVSSELATPLMDMGMKRAFEPGANFSAMCNRQVFISRVIHKVAMKMDETGTEAAAATAVMMMKTAFPMEEDRPFSMIVDRPYGIALRHRASEQILLWA